MPKTPILNRTLLYMRIGRSEPPTYRLLDWNIVNTSLGAMMEPRQLRMLEGGKLVNVDVTDVSFNAIQEYNEDRMYSETGQSGPQAPRDFNA